MWLTLARWFGIEVIKVIFNYFVDAYRQWYTEKKLAEEQRKVEEDAKKLEEAKTVQEKKDAIRQIADHSF